MNTTPTTPTPLGDMLLSPQGVDILHQGIRAALVNEAMKWTKDSRTAVWMALIGAAHEMGIHLTKDELHAEATKRRLDDAQHHDAPDYKPVFLWSGERAPYVITKPPSSTDGPNPTTSR